MPDQRIRLNPRRSAFRDYDIEVDAPGDPPSGYSEAAIPIAARRVFRALRSACSTSVKSSVSCRLATEYFYYTRLEPALTNWYHYESSTEEDHSNLNVGEWHLQERSLRASLKLWISLQPFQRVDLLFERNSTRRAFLAWAKPLVALSKTSADVVLGDIDKILELFPNPEDKREKLARCLLTDGSQTTVARKILGGCSIGTRLLYRWQKAHQSTAITPKRTPAKRSEPALLPTPTPAGPDLNKVRSMRATAFEASAVKPTTVDDPGVKPESRPEALQRDGLHSLLAELVGSPVPAPSKNLHDVTEAVASLPMEPPGHEQLATMLLDIERAELAAGVVASPPVAGPAADVTALGSVKRAMAVAVPAPSVSPQDNISADTSAAFDKLLADSRGDRDRDAFAKLTEQLVEALTRIGTLEAARLQPDPVRLPAARYDEDPTFTRQVDAKVTIYASHHKTSKQLFSRCLRPGCDKVLRPGAENCSCMAPASLCDLRCESCGIFSMSSLEEIFSKSECQDCGVPRFFNMRDAYERIKWKIKMPASKLTAKYIDDPPSSMAHAFTKATRISKVSNDITMRLRAEHDSSLNDLLIPGATDANGILQGADEACTGIPGHKILPIKIDFDFDTRLLLATLSGLAWGNTFDDDPTFVAGPSDIRAMSDQHTSSTSMVWSKRVLEAPVKTEKWEGDDAKRRLRWAFDCITLIIRYVLSNKLADEHAELVEVIMEAHIADTFPAVDFDLQMCFKIHRVCIAWWRKAMQAHVSKHNLAPFEEDLLWVNEGTDCARPMLYCRSFRDGSQSGEWCAHIRAALFQPRDQAAKRHARDMTRDSLLGGSVHDRAIAQGLGLSGIGKNGSAPATLVQPPAAPRVVSFQLPTATSAAAQTVVVPTTARVASVFGNIPALKEFTSKNEVAATATFTLYPSKNKSEPWLRIPMSCADSDKKDRFCTNCLRMGHICSACTQPQHNSAYTNAKLEPLWHLESLAKALADPTDAWIIYRKLILELKTPAGVKPAVQRKRGASTGKNGGLPRPIVNLPAIPSPENKLAQWMSGEPEAMDMDQLDLDSMKARIQIGPRVNVKHTTPNVKLPLRATRSVKVTVPARSNANGLHDFNAVAECYGGNLATPFGVESERCGFVTLGVGIREDAGELLLDARRSCIRVIEQKDRVFDNYEHLNCVSVVDAFETRMLDSAASIIEPDQPSSNFHLRVVWPDLARDKCVMVLFEVAGLPHWQLYLPASSSGYCATLDSEVVHLMSADQHMYLLKWECGLSRLGDVLGFVGKVYRFSDVGLHLCLNVEDTLNSAVPVALPFLQGAESLICSLDANLHIEVLSSSTGVKPVGVSADYKNGTTVVQDQCWVCTNGFIKVDGDLTACAACSMYSDGDEFASQSTGHWEAAADAAQSCGVELVSVVVQSTSNWAPLEVSKQGWGISAVGYLCGSGFVPRLDATSEWPELEHPAALSLLRHIDDTVQESVGPFGFDSDKRILAVRQELSRVCDVVAWKLHFKSATLCLRNLLATCKDLNKLLDTQKWALRMIAKSWSRPLTSSMCLTLRPTLHCFSGLMTSAMDHVFENSIGVVSALSWAKLYCKRTVLPLWRRLTRAFNLLACRTRALDSIKRAHVVKHYHNRRMESLWSSIGRNCAASIDGFNCLLLFKVLHGLEVQGKRPRRPLQSPTPAAMLTTAVSPFVTQIVSPANDAVERSSVLWTHLYAPYGSEATYIPVIFVSSLHRGQARVKLESEFGLRTSFVEAGRLVDFDEALVGEEVCGTPRFFAQLEAVPSVVGSPASGSVSPIAAHQVDHGCSPRTRYAQARARAENPPIKNVEDFYSWKQRMQSRNTCVTPRRSGRVRTATDNWRPSVSSPELESDLSDSLSDDEYQRTVSDRHVRRCWLEGMEVEAELVPPQPKSEVASFMEALPVEMRAPSSKEVHLLSQGRLKQSTLSWGKLSSGPRVKLPTFMPKVGGLGAEARRTYREILRRWDVVLPVQHNHRAGTAQIYDTGENRCPTIPRPRPAVAERGPTGTTLDLKGRPTKTVASVDTPAGRGHHHKISTVLRRCVHAWSVSCRSSVSADFIQGPASTGPC